jgi:hypothetical protein
VEKSQIIHGVELIEHLAVKDLKAIIERIPADCLPLDLGKHLITALDQRRSQLRQLLQLQVHHDYISAWSHLPYLVLHGHDAG